MMPCGAESAPPLNRPVAVSQGHAVDRKQRLACPYVENCGADRIGSYGSPRLLRPQTSPPELWFKKTVHRASLCIELGLGESLEQRGGQDDFVEHDGLAPVLEHPAQDDHGIADLELERPRDFGRGLASTNVEQAACRVFVATVVATNAQKPKQRRLFLGMRRNERPLALAANNEALSGERVDGFAHRSLRDTKALRKRHLARNGLARRPFAVVEAGHEERLDLHVQRLERRRFVARGNAHRNLLAGLRGDLKNGATRLDPLIS